MTAPIDSFACRRALPGFDAVDFMSLPAAEAAGAGPVSRLPYALRALAETMLRREDGVTVTADQIRALAFRSGAADVAFHPGRVLMQDSSGLPILADLVALMQAAEDAGRRVALPDQMTAHLVVDHAVEVDHWGSAQAAELNLAAEFDRHGSRYTFLRWAEQRFPWLRIAPPGSGICHQLNLEILASVVTVFDGLAGCDTLVGADSHTTMVNALGIVGWGVGGIEATSVLLGDPIVMRLPRVTGVRLTGAPRPGVTATDVALALTATLRSAEVVGEIVEFCGPGLAALSVPDRATTANMAPEYGATMGFFPADHATLDYLRATGRPAEAVDLAEAFLRAQGMLRADGDPEPLFDRILDFDLSLVERSLAGPSRPEQTLPLADGPASLPLPRDSAGLQDGDVVIAAITSCTNTSNPKLLVAAGLLARKAVARGLVTKPWVKTSLAPGSRIASGLLVQAGLQADLDRLGFQVVGHGCTTCMGNSGPLPAPISETIAALNLSVAAVLSGNRNFEGRVHPQCRLAYLMSPPLVVAYALAGTLRIDLTAEPLAQDVDGRPVFLRDIWPEEAEIDAALALADIAGLADANRRSYRQGTPAWRELRVPPGARYPWEGESGFIRQPPFLAQDAAEPLLGADIHGGRALLMLGDGVTTDHISPVSAIAPQSAAGTWLADAGVAPHAMASFSARRLNHEVMLRGGFANPRLRNALANGTEGGVTRLSPDGEIMPVHEAAAAFAARRAPLLVIAGARYGAGSARDWAAKVTRLLGVCAVVAESFERIHRTNLVAMGVLPVVIPRELRRSLTGWETFDIEGLPAALKPGGEIRLTIHTPGGDSRSAVLACQIQTSVEAEWLRGGGILPRILAKAEPASRLAVKQGPAST
jgi:aconitate hydratase